MNNREKMKAGKLFQDGDCGLPEEKLIARKLRNEYNSTAPEEFEKRAELLTKILGSGKDITIEQPFFFNYGKNIHAGEMIYINMNCTFIDDGDITIGSRVCIGPSVTVASVGHPIIPEKRMFMYTDPVVIGNDCWIGANVTILPGVHIGDGTVIGAGSVVTKDIPAGVIAVGNPCKVLRKVDERDYEFYYKDRKFED